MKKNEIKAAFKKYYETPVTKTQLKRVKLAVEEQVFQAEKAGFYGGFIAGLQAAIKKL